MTGSLAASAPAAGGGLGADLAGLAVRAGRPGLLLLPLPAGLGAVVGGWAGLIGATLGWAVPLAFFSTTALVVVLAGRMARALVVPYAMTAYTLKAVLLGVGVVTLPGVTWLAPLGVAWAALAGTLLWVAALVRAALAPHAPLLDP